jgi:hypothetical protein
VRAARALAELSTAESSRFDRLLLEAFALAARSPEAAEVLSSSMNVFLDGLFEQVSAAVESGVIDPSLSRDALRHLFASWMFGAIVSRTLGANRVRGSRSRPNAGSHTSTPTASKIAA